MLLKPSSLPNHILLSKNFNLYLHILSHSGIVDVRFMFASVPVNTIIFLITQPLHHHIPPNSWRQEIGKNFAGLTIEAFYYGIFSVSCTSNTGVTTGIANAVRSHLERAYNVFHCRRLKTVRAAPSRSAKFLTPGIWEKFCGIDDWGIILCYFHVSWTLCQPVQILLPVTNFSMCKICTNWLRV